MLRRTWFSTQSLQLSRTASNVNQSAFLLVGTTGKCSSWASRSVLWHSIKSSAGSGTHQETEPGLSCWRSVIKGLILGGQQDLRSCLGLKKEEFQFTFPTLEKCPSLHVTSHSLSLWWVHSCWKGKSSFCCCTLCLLDHSVSHFKSLKWQKTLSEEKKGKKPKQVKDGVLPF